MALIVFLQMCSSFCLIYREEHQSTKIFSFNKQGATSMHKDSATCKDQVPDLQWGQTKEGGRYGNHS